MKWSMHKGPGHHLLVPSQYMGGGPRVKVFSGCGLVMGEKGVYFGVPAQTFGKRCLVGMASHPKEVNMG